MSDETKDTRLPPPAFPPGSRKHLHTNSDIAPRMPASSNDAFISPDDPIPARRGGVGDAFISPDDPMPPRRSDAVQGAFISPDDPMPARTAVAAHEEEEEGVVTGMSHDAHLEPEELVSGGDPHVMELVESVGKLAEALKRKGEAGLRTGPMMTRFDATLRSYCVGYLAGRRAEDQVDVGE